MYGLKSLCFAATVFAGLIVAYDEDTVTVTARNTVTYCPCEATDISTTCSTTSGDSSSPSFWPTDAHHETSASGSMTTQTESYFGSGGAHASYTASNGYSSPHFTYNGTSTNTAASSSNTGVQTTPSSNSTSTNVTASSSSSTNTIASFNNTSTSTNTNTITSSSGTTSGTTTTASSGSASTSTIAPYANSTSTNTTTPSNSTGEYEYIVVGSGAGGGVLAARLAQLGHSVLLIEAGDDQGANYNTTVPGYQALVTNDPKIRWDIFANHYQDLQQAERDPKFTYTLPNGTYYVGLNPPPGAKPTGILYPRAATLGGCVSHNALIYIEPFQSDWNNIAQITGDDSWTYDNMLQYYDLVNQWQPVAPTDPTILLRDLMFTRHLAGGAAVQGVQLPVVDTATGLIEALAVNPNSRLPGRDSEQGFFQIPLIQENGARVSVRDRIVNVVNQGYPLTIRPNTLVTKIIFDKNHTEPKAIGVAFLEGAQLYSANAYYNPNARPKSGQVFATKEVIIAGGTFNTPQILKLSGIGPADELRSFGIPVVKDLPGVGVNMQDRYEISVNVVHPNDFAVLDGCTFDEKPHDLCFTQWLDNPVEVAASRGAYASDGLGASMIVRSPTAPSTNFDNMIFGGPINFTGYFPGWPDAAVRHHTAFSWYSLLAGGRNKAGTVKLRSTDPREQPQIDFNYFYTGTTTDDAPEKDLDAIVNAIGLARDALTAYDALPQSALPGTQFNETLPGSQVASDAQLKQYIQDQAWGHHASCTCKIGNDSDSLAVLDSEFRVRGVQNLRVVDASVFPHIPGIFIQSPIFIMAEKAADVISKGSSTKR